jgi:hypothetical protein
MSTLQIRRLSPSSVVPAKAGTYVSKGRVGPKETETPEQALFGRRLFGVGPGFRRDDDFGDVGAKNGMHCGTACLGNFPAFGS